MVNKMPQSGASRGIKRAWNPDEANRIVTSSSRPQAETSYTAHSQDSHDISNLGNERNFTDTEDPTYLQSLYRIVKEESVREYTPPGVTPSPEVQLEYFRRYFPGWQEHAPSTGASATTTTTTTTTTDTVAAHPTFTRQLPHSRARVERSDVSSDVVSGRLTGPQLQQLLTLHLRDPQQYTAEFLAQRFQITVDDVTQLLQWVRIPKTFKYERPKTSR